MIVELNLGKLKLKGPRNDYNRFLDIFGDAYVSLLKQRLDSGIDINGNAFAPYSVGYAKLRAVNGRNPNGDFLQVTGKMKQSMGIVARVNNSITIGFSGSRPPGGLSYGVKTYKSARSGGEMLTKGKRRSKKTTTTSRRSGGSITQDKEMIFNAEIAYAHNEGIGRYGPTTQRKFFGVVKTLVAHAIAMTLKQVVNWSKSI